MTEYDLFEPLSSEQRGKLFRARAKAEGRPASRGKSRSRGKGGKTPSLFDAARFVAIDGEGFNAGEPLVWIIRDGAHVSRYTGQDHEYALLSASDGSEIYNPTGRLSTRECLDFLCDIVERDPKSVLVVFGGSYDVTHILHDLSVGQLRDLLGKGADGEAIEEAFTDLTLGGFDYRLELRPRKSFTVRRWPTGAAKYEVKGKSRTLSKHTRAVLWDVWGYFQDSFVGVMEKWLPGNPDYEFIRAMKGDRKIFERTEIDRIRAYNQAELRCLVAIMVAVRDAMRQMDLKVTRWDGAGSIAAAILRKHEVKSHKAETPADVFTAARHAYSGGHIECSQIGTHDGPVWAYDINSAYPAEFADLPSLQDGVWQRGTGEPPSGFTLVCVRYSFNYGAPFYPLFYREEDGSILYPREGFGWYWHCEYDAARQFKRQFGAKLFEVVEWWHFKQTTNARKPFGWVTEYYSRRQSLIESATLRGETNGEEKIIKLGLNSLYGKTAQQLGARDGKPPAYFQLEWAGAVTAGCRARLMLAALDDPQAVIAFATDGLFTSRELSIVTPKAKLLGAWGVKRYEGITMVMPGVYWLHSRPGEFKHYSRGFDKDAMRDPQLIMKHWAKRNDECAIELTRMVGIGTAILGSVHFQMRGLFVTSARSLRLDGMNSKRHPLTLGVSRPHRQLCFCHPRAAEDAGAMSAPYDIDWIRTDDMEQEREADDADLS